MVHFTWSLLFRCLERGESKSWTSYLFDTIWRTNLLFISNLISGSSKRRVSSLCQSLHCLTAVIFLCAGVSRMSTLGLCTMRLTRTSYWILSRPVPWLKATREFFNTRLLLRTPQYNETARFSTFDLPSENTFSNTFTSPVEDFFEDLLEHIKRIRTMGELPVNASVPQNKVSFIHSVNFRIEHLIWDSFVGRRSGCCGWFLLTTLLFGNYFV